MTTTTQPPVTTTAPGRSRPPTDHGAIAAQIALVLGETKPRVIAQIKYLTWALGHRQALYLMHQALAIQKAGGLLIVSGTRPRTLGGVFFWLAYTCGQPKPGVELRQPVPQRVYKLAQADAKKKSA